MTSESEALEAFFALYELDLEKGGARPLADYQAPWPEHAAAIRAAFDEINTGGPSDPALANLAAVNLAPPQAGIRHQIGTAAEEARDPATSHAGIPRLIGPYALARLLGRGGMGEVWLAAESHPRRHIALKLLRRDRTTPELLRRFEYEAELLGRVNHPGIAQIHAAGSAETGDGPQAYIAMQFVAGSPLSRLLDARAEKTRADSTAADTATAGTPTASRRGLTVPDAATARADATLIEKTARALHAAHEAGIIHRDVKPANIIVTPENEPVVVDFGIARDAYGALTTLTQEGAAPGTPYYMSPEQIRGAPPVDRRTDIWALGVTLYELVTGERPFRGASFDVLRTAILTTDPVPARRMNRNLPRDLEVILATALEKEPGRRYATAKDLAEDLKNFREGRPIAARPLTWFGKILRWARREPGSAALSAALLLLIPFLASTVTYLLSTRDEVEAARAQATADEIEGVLEDGFLELKQTGPAAARREFERLDRLDPGNLEARTGIAITWLVAKEPARALDVIAAGPSGTPALERLHAETLARLGRTEDATRILDSLGEPSSALEWYVAGWIENLRGRSGDAAAAARAIERLNMAIKTARRARLIYHVELALSAGYGNNPADAESSVRALRTLWPKSEQAYLAAHLALRRTGAPAATRIMLLEEGLRSIAAQGTNARQRAKFHANLGLEFLDLGRQEESLRASETALTFDPDLVSALTNKAIVLGNRGDHAAALVLLVRAVEIEPTSTNALNTLGNSLVFTGRFEEAERCLQKVLDLDPGFDAAWVNLGRAALGRGDVDLAIEHLQRGLTLNPRSVPGLVNLGQVLLRKGRQSAALEAFNKALALDPKSPAIRSSLCLLLRDLRRFDEALAVIEEEVRLRPEEAEAVCNQAHILMDLGRYREALAAFERGHELGSARKDWKYPSASWVAGMRPRAAKEERCEPYFTTDELPESPELAADAAYFALRRGFPARAVSLWSFAFEKNQELAEDLAKNHRHNAAIAAARAAADPALDEASLARLRAKLLRWLSSELAAYRTRYEDQRIRESQVRRMLEDLQNEKSFNPYRPEALDALPPSERPAWLAFWAAVETLESELR